MTPKKGVMKGTDDQNVGICRQELKITFIPVLNSLRKHGYDEVFQPRNGNHKKEINGNSVPEAYDR